MQRQTHLILRRLFAALGATAATAAALSAGTAIAATPGATAKADCPSGNVCIYPGNDASGDPDKYYRYGSYNLSDMFGAHLIVNNQTGNAGLRLCTGYGGQQCGERMGPGSYHPDLTPINSIMVER